jgi:hypothetical protein
MSIGNLKDSGNQGNNLPFQWKVLQGLQAIYDEVKLPLTCVEDSVTICNDNIDALTFTGDALNVNIENTSVTVDGGTGVSRTPNAIRPTNTSGTVTGTIYSISVANVGAADGTVLTSVTTIKPGEVLNFSADAINNFFTSFDYNATGTEFIIIYVA